MQYSYADVTLPPMKRSLKSEKARITAARPRPLGGQLAQRSLTMGASCRRCCARFGHGPTIRTGR